VTLLAHDGITISLYGITCVQTFIYYQLFDRDYRVLKLAASKCYLCSRAILNIMVVINRCFSCGRFVAIARFP
jgi:hypothetical protein